MNSCVPALREFLRTLSMRILPPALILVSAGILFSQFVEIGGNGEVLSLTSFVVLISFSGIGFGWARVNGIPEEIAHHVRHAAADLFTASLLAVVALFFSWVRTLQAKVITMLAIPLFALHWIFLFLSVVLSLTALICLLDAARQDRE